MGLTKGVPFPRWTVISVENREKFPTPCVLCPTDGIPKLGIGARSQKKTKMMWLPDGRKSFKMGLAV